jgi:hypothetical protein
MSKNSWSTKLPTKEVVVVLSHKFQSGLWYNNTFLLEYKSSLEFLDNLGRDIRLPNNMA